MMHAFPLQDKLLEDDQTREADTCRGPTCLTGQQFRHTLREYGPNCYSISLVLILVARSPMLVYRVLTCHKHGIAAK